MYISPHEGGVTSGRGKRLSSSFFDRAATEACDGFVSCFRLQEKQTWREGNNCPLIPSARRIKQTNKHDQRRNICIQILPPTPLPLPLSQFSNKGRKQNLPLPPSPIPSLKRRKCGGGGGEGGGRGPHASSGHQTRLQFRPGEIPRVEASLGQMRTLRSV